MDATTARFHNFLQGNVIAIEVTLLLLSFLSILLYYFDIPSSGLFLVRSVNLVAITYLLFASFEGKAYHIAAIGPRIKAIGFSMAILGALFKLLNYPAHGMMLKIAVLSLLIAVLIWGFNNRRNWRNNWVASVIRISLITTVGLVLKFL